MNNETPNPAAPTPDLAPCPFCKATESRFFQLDESNIQVSCNGCNASGPYDITERLAAKKWNRRTPIPPAPSPSLREAIAGLLLADYQSQYYGGKASDFYPLVDGILALIAPAEAKAEAPAVSQEAARDLMREYLDSHNAMDYDAESPEEAEAMRPRAKAAEAALLAALGGQQGPTTKETK